MPALTKEEAEKLTDLIYKVDTRRFGLGTGEIESFKDDRGDEFLFKPAQNKRGVESPYRAYIQEAVSKLQGLINPTSRVEVKTAVVNGRFGAVQPYIRSLTLSKKGLDNLTKDQVAELLGEYVVDYLACNFDSHSENYLIDRLGHVRGVDKEQSFRYLDEPKSNDLRMLTNFNQRYDEAPPIYGKFLGYLESEYYGKIDILGILGKYMDRLADISDYEYVAIFDKYAEARAGGDNVKKTAILSKILMRRTKMLVNYNRALVNAAVAEKEGRPYNIFKDKETFGRNREHEFNLVEDSLIRYTDDTTSFYDAQAGKLLDGDSLFSILKTNDGITRVLVTPANGQNILLSFDSNEEMVGKLEQLVLNIAEARTGAKPLVITTESSRKTMFKPGPENAKKGSYSSKFYEIFSELCRLYRVDRTDIATIMQRIKEKQYSYFTIGELKELFENPYSNKAFSRRYRKFEEQEKDQPLNPTTVELEQEKERVLKKFLVELGRDKTYICSSPDEILINGQKMMPSRSAAKRLIERAVRYDENGEYLDFTRKSYYDSVKDLLVRELLGRTYEFTPEQKELLVTYKGAGFFPFNSFTRGAFRLFESRRDNVYNEFKIDEIVESLLRIEAIAKALPARDYNILLSRLGSGKTKIEEVGSRNDYDSLVSFAVNGGTNQGSFESGDVRYTRILKKDETAIPMEIFTRDAFPRNPSECEILTMPFSYSVGKIIRGIETSRMIVMQDCREIDFSLLLERRVEQLIERETRRLEDFNKSKDAIKHFGTKEEVEAFRAKGLTAYPVTLQQSEDSLRKALARSSIVAGSFFESDARIKRTEGDKDSSVHDRKYAFLKKMCAEQSDTRDYTRQLVEAIDLLQKIGPERRNVSAEEITKKYGLSKNKEYLARIVSFAVSDDRSSMPSEEEYGGRTIRALVPAIADFIKLYNIAEGTNEGEIREEDFETEYGKSMITTALRMNESFSDMVNVLGTDVKKAEELIEEGKRARKVLENAKEHPYEEHLKSRRLAYYDEERAKEIVLSKAPEEQKRKISKAQIVVMSKKRSSDKILDAIEQAKQLIKSKFSKDRFRG